ncbi:MAG: diacylglycerol/lipid kinase family protein [Sulfobacillus sp.]
MSVTYIVNLTAGRGLTQRLWPVLSRSVGKDDHVAVTQRPGHATELARAAVAAGASRVVAVGGDGTVAEVAKGLLRTDVQLGHVPTGAGCDLARALGLPKVPADAMAALDQLRPTALDVGMAGDEAFLTVSGVGFDAVVAAEDARTRATGMTGTLPYLLATFKVLRTYRPRLVRLTLDGQEVAEQRALLVAVANSQYYAGGMRIAPYALTGDGLLDVVVVGDLSVADTLLTLPKVFSGAHRSHPKVSFYQAKEVIVEAPEPLSAHLGGEPAGTTPVTFRVLPQALTVLSGVQAAPMDRP